MAESCGKAGSNPLEGDGDCARCAALCCMALAFDTGQGFGIDKANATPCPHLDKADRCRIHDRREAEGFASCVTFDCGGVGQYVSETVFAGQHWRGDPALAREMTSAFSALREVAALSELLEAAGGWPLSEDDEAERHAWLCRLWSGTAWTPSALGDFQASGTARDIRGFLRSLRRYGRHRRPAA